MLLLQPPNQLGRRIGLKALNARLDQLGRSSLSSNSRATRVAVLVEGRRVGSYSLHTSNDFTSASVIIPGCSANNSRPKSV